MLINSKILFFSLYKTHNLFILWSDDYSSMTSFSFYMQGKFYITRKIKKHCSRFRTSEQNLIKVEWSLVKKICQGKLNKKIYFLNYPLRLYFNCFSSLHRHGANELEVAHFILPVEVCFSYLLSSPQEGNLSEQEKGCRRVGTRVQTEEQTTGANSLLEAGESQQLLCLPSVRLSATGDWGQAASHGATGRAESRGTAGRCFSTLSTALSV